MKKQPKPKSESTQETKPGIKSKPGPKPKPGLVSKPKSVPTPETKPKPGPKSKPVPKPKPGPESKSRSKSKPEPKSKPRSKTKTVPGPKPNPMPKPGPKPKPNPKPKPGPKSKSRSGFKIVPVSNPRPKTKSGYTPKPVSKWHVSLTDLAEFYGAPHVSTITKQIKIEGFPADCKIRHGVYDLKKYNDWRMDHFFGNLDTKTTMAAEKLRYQVARANREENADKKERGTLLDRVQLVQSLSIVLTGLRNRFLGWYKTLPPMLAGKDEKQMGMILRAEIMALLADLAAGVQSILPRKKRTPKRRAVENKKN